MYFPRNMKPKGSDFSNCLKLNQIILNYFLWICPCFLAHLKNMQFVNKPPVKSWTTLIHFNLTMQFGKNFTWRQILQVPLLIGAVFLGNIYFTTTFASRNAKKVPSKLSIYTSWQHYYRAWRPICRKILLCFSCELRWPAWAVGCYSISQSARGTSQNIIFKTLRPIGRPALYFMYRVIHLLWDLGWVDFEHLPGLLGIWQKRLRSWARWRNFQIKVNLKAEKSHCIYLTNFAMN